jgi:hypothetical protein
MTSDARNERGSVKRIMLVASLTTQLACNGSSSSGTSGGTTGASCGATGDGCPSGRPDSGTMCVLETCDGGVCPCPYPCNYELAFCQCVVNEAQAKCLQSCDECCPAADAGSDCRETCDANCSNLESECEHNCEGGSTFCLAACT